MKNLFCLVIALQSCFSFAQSELAFIQFNHKDETPYSLSQPIDFLTQASIDRRANRGVAVDSFDLPVIQRYLDSLNAFATSQVMYSSRWLNGALIQYQDSLVLDSIADLDFVVAAEIREHLNEANLVNKEIESLSLKSDREAHTANGYGDSYEQLNQVNLPALHVDGYKGDGVTIAVLDAGFNYADTMGAFEAIWNENRMWATYDFVRNDTLIYTNLSNHGQQVFGVIGADVPNDYVGAAPDANYMLFRTEDAANEYLGELYFWIVAAERADSLGADIINTSLGYTDFDNPDNDFVYEDLDGQTTPIAQGVNFAASRGILCVISAGNDGDKSWGYISTPADALDGLAVGAVNSAGYYAAFSSFGPTADGRIKPDVTAQGERTVLISRLGSTFESNGTSFSAPIITGGLACVLQKHPSFSVQKYFEELKRSATQFNSPSVYMGYGIPNFLLAADYLTGIKDVEGSIDGEIKFIHQQLVWPVEWEVKQIEIFSIIGQTVLRKANLSTNGMPFSPNNSGVYLVQITLQDGSKHCSKLYLTNL